MAARIGAGQAAARGRIGRKTGPKPAELSARFVNFLIEITACCGLSGQQERSGSMGIHSAGMAQGHDDANLRLVRFFSICLGSLVFVYSLLAVRLFLDGSSFAAGRLGPDRAACAARRRRAGRHLLSGRGWRARWSSRIGEMGRLFEAASPTPRAKEKIRLIVLVTMVSLLLELVMIRWLASVFPVFSFFKNFTLLACFLGLGAGYAVAEKQPCAPALVLPMLACFVGVITLLRYDVGATTEIFSALPMQEQTSISIWMDKLNWLSLFQQQRAALSAARHELRALRLHLLSRGPALRQAARRHRCAEGLWPQPDRQHPRRAGAVRDEPVLAAAGDLVRRGRRRPALFRAGARRQTAAARRRKLQPAARGAGLAGADRHPAHLFALSVAGEDGEVRRADEHPVGRLLLPEGLQPLRGQSRP